MGYKPKVVFVVPWLGIVDRGSEVTAWEMARRMGDRFEIIILAYRKKKNETSSTLGQNDKNFKLTRLPRQFFLVTVFGYLLLNSCDLIYPNNGLWGAVVCRIIRIIKGTPFVMKSNGGIEPITARQRPNVFVCDTPVVFDWYAKHIPGLKLKLISPGVDLEKFSRGKTKLKLDLQLPIILCVGALIEAKRQHLAIQAVAKLKKASLLIVGQGELRDELQKMGEQLLGKQRFEIRQVRYQEIQEYYKLATVFTLPSWEEPFGVVYLEAMASNLPVIATDDRQRRYLIENAGILCNVENVDEYANALKKALLTDFRNKPRNQAKNFSWQKQTHMFEQLFLDTIYGKFK